MNDNHENELPVTQATASQDTASQDTAPQGTASQGEPVDPLTAVMGGGLDLGAMMQAAQSMQEQMADAQRKLGDARVVGTAGGGLVSVTLNGHLHLIEVRIDPDGIDPEDPSMVEDLLRAAWQDAHDQVAVLQQQADPMAGLLGGGGGSLGGLGDLLGGI